ncbi:MAG TPA: hypothetical protein VNT51_06010, partial [Miltoncostaeaceae bacterium]|nr:hypothetical protein [Miltoncostaeaceae bacterium]
MGDRLWEYARVARVWAWVLVGVGLGMLALGALVEAGDPEDGLEGRWVLVALAAFASAVVVFVPLLRMWMRPAAVPSGRLPDAARDTRAPRLLEAGPGDWRVWAVLVALGTFVVSAMMMGFLVGILGGGGMAEGVVAGILVAWGLVTLEDVREVGRRQEEEGRVYYAACRRPVAVGGRLVWRVAGAAEPEEPAAPRGGARRGRG